MKQKLIRRGALRRAIFEFGMQKKFAEKCEISDAYLSQIVNGRMNPTGDEIARICRALGRTARSLDL